MIQLKRRLKTNNYLIRFWSNPDLYKQFKIEVRKYNIPISDVFKYLMGKFIEDSKNGKISVES